MRTQIIDGYLGIRCKLIGYQYSEISLDYVIRHKMAMKRIKESPGW